ncbi:molybdopterin synthase [Haloplanus sp. GCM10025708]|uniref:molybdopterin synthase n=1 Tax=Haloferacaceae TaxID=1644056 RepID=UPI003617BDD1
MNALAIVGPGATPLVERLAPRLDGTVATVEPLPETASRDVSATASYGLSEDGSWIGAGEDRTLTDLLDSLSARYDYALVADYSRTRLPTVTVGDAETAGDVVYAVDDADAADVDALLDIVDAVDPYVTLDSLVARAKSSPRADRAGAIATFTGRVRARDAEDDSRTVRLEFEKYEGVAEEKMDAISRELEARDGVQKVLMYHRTGVIEDGEDIVFVVVLAGHRAEAFRTVEDGIDRLKDEVPIFKKETTVDEEFWVHDRA